MEDISIIGSTDGTTSIYIASTMNWPLIVGVGVVVILVSISLVVWKKKHR